MRSFLGRDILSLKGFGREEYFRIFEVADELAPFARDRRTTNPAPALAWPTRLQCIVWVGTYSAFPMRK
jgi:hypothetical protein